MAINPTSPWLRRLVVTLGPLEEWRGKSAGETVRFESDGTPKSLKATARVHRTLMGMAQPSDISVFNLAADTRDAIKADLTKITIEAGWGSSTLHKLFQGSVLSAESERSGADIVTRISALPGYGALVRGVSSRTFSEGTPLAAVVKELAGDLPGLTVADSGLEGLQGSIRNGGWSFAGSTKDAMTQLANEYGFSWHVDDGAFKALGDKAAFGGVTVLNGNNGGLISVTPILSGAMQAGTGVTIRALYVPGVTAGSTVRVNSTMYPKLNGEYRANTITVSADTHGDQWTMDIESFKPL